MDLLKGFNKEEHSLYHAHARIWQEFIFINLSEDPIPFEDDLAPLLNKWEDKKIHELRIANKVEYHLNCNWKLILQNYQECYHCPGVHPLLSKLTPYRSAVHDCGVGGIIGGYMSINEPRGSMTMDGKAAAPLLGNTGEDEQQKIYYYSIYPNMLLTPHPDYVLYHVLTPISYNEVQLECHWLFHPDVINSADYKDRIRSAIEFWDMTNKQDWEVCEQMQQGVASARFDRGYYAGQEDMLAAIDQETLRSLGHDDPS
ncbi:MAG: hypothetical protein JKX95_06580 [Bacteroidia bacterium]|nr:hypothetical protein [Bacteroidia bacterium]